MELFLNSEKKVGFLHRSKIIVLKINQLDDESIRETLAGLGWKKNTIVMRFFDASRLPQFFKQGIDRDSNSIIHRGHPEDIQHSFYGVEDESGLADRITYARTIDLTASPMTSLAQFARPQEDGLVYFGKQIEKDLSFLKSLGSNKAIVFYDPDEVHRVSENEYHFVDGDPKDAVVGLIIDSDLYNRIDFPAACCGWSL